MHLPRNGRLRIEWRKGAGPGTLTLGYATFGVLWIVASGYLLGLALDSAELQYRLEIVKGLLFVAVTSGLLYLLLRHQLPRLPTEAGAMAEARARVTGVRRLGLVLGGLALLVPLLAFTVVSVHGPRLERQIFAELAAIAALKADQVGHWLDERRADVRSLSDNHLFQQRIVAMMRDDDLADRAVVRDRLTAFQEAYHYDSIEVLEADGERRMLIGSEAPGHVRIDMLLAAARSGSDLARGEIYRDAGGHLHMDFVVPVRPRPGPQAQPVAYLLIHASPARFLLPHLQTWPTMSRSGELLLVRREGEHIMYLNELRHRRHTAMQMQMPMATPRLPAAAALRSATPGTFAGTDYRDTQVLSAFHPVAGTGWRLVAKVDREEVMAPARALAFWVSVVAFFAIAAVSAALLVLWRQQQDLRGLAVEAERARGERALRHFYELPFIGMAITSPATKRWTQFNDRLCEILGYSRDELGRLNWAEVTHPEDLDADVAEFNRVMAGESEGYAMNKRFIRKDGAVVHAIIDVKCVRTADGSVDYFVATVEDVTERSRMTQALTESESFLRTLVDAIPDLVWAKDTAGRYRLANPVFERFFGAPEAEIVGHTDHEFVERELADQFSHYDQKVIASGRQSVNEEWITFRADGRQALVETFKSPLKDGDGRVTGVLGIARDITARKTAEAQVRRLTRLYATLSQCNKAIVHATDADALFQSFCRAMVEVGGFRLAWIGLVDDDAGVGPRAWHGEGADHVRGWYFPLAEGDDDGPVARAVREEQPYWSGDFIHDPATRPWHELGRHYGYQASATLPVRRSDRVVGVLNLAAGEADAFDEDARELLLETAMDLGFALEVFAREADRQRSEAARREALERLTKIASRVPGMVYQYRQCPDGRAWFPFVSDAIRDIYGFGPEAVREDATPAFAVVHPEDREGLAASIQYSMDHLTPWQHEFRIHGADGNERWLLGNAMPEDRPEADGCVLWHGFVTDFTERKQAEYQLHIAAKVFEQGNEGIIITGPDTRIMMVNKAFTRITGYSEAEAVGQTPAMLSSGYHDEDFYRTLWASVSTLGYWQGEIWNRRKDGGIYPEWLSIDTVTNEAGEITEYIGVFSDITRQKEDQDRIQKLAYYDPLTGLPNRTLLADRLAHAITMAQRRQSPLALLYLDLDHFKKVNDTLGHRIGDELLVEVAQRLTASVRGVDTVARQGGDEFMVVLPGTDAEGAAHVATKLLERIGEAFHVRQYELTVTPSIGIVQYPADGPDFATLYSRVDIAMYRAKQDGRNVFRFFTEEMQALSARSLRLETDLRRALEREELELHYQPQFHLEGGHMVGMEALVRWRHHALGMVSPAEFIPIAEDSGQILAIGDWVLRTALYQLKAWMAAGMAPVTLAVNLSAVQFRDAALPETVCRLLEETGVAAHLLELELTESVAMEDPDQAVRMVSELQRLGVRVSIDDFGTGYSSLSQLKRFAIHKLKIDKAFVRDVTSDPDDRAIVSAIIGLADSLGLVTIAEGVETTEQLEFLREEGCDEVQGYLFSRPLPGPEFEAFWRQRAAADEAMVAEEGLSAPDG